MSKARSAFLLICTLLTVAMFFPQRQALAASYMQAKTDANLRGIDVSHWNGTIDWQQVKNFGIAFAYLKASEGTSYTDPYFSSYVSSARAASLPIGAYHYARPSAPFNANEPKAQAQFFVNVMNQNGLADFGDIMPVLDLEQPATAGSLSPSEIAQWARIFVDTVKSLTNRQIMIYTGVWFVQQYSDLGGALADLPVWIADYTRFGDPQPPVCGGWTQWTVWQHTDQGSVPGISGIVDLDAGPTSLAALKGNISAPASPPAAPTNFAAGSITADSMSLSWTAVSGAQSYTLSRNGAAIYQGTGTSYVDTGLGTNSTYTYTLTATNASGSSSPVSITATTLQNRLISTVTTNSASYYSGSYATITTTVKDGNNQLIKGAAVKLTIKNPRGVITNATGTTDANGKFEYRYYIPKNTRGTFTVSTHSTLSNFTASDAGTTFNVVK